MYKINFNEPVHIHFIGIGGISMSGLAEILLDEHFTVSGSDNKESSLTDHLVSMGAKVFIGQKASNIEDTVQVVVYTAAIHEDNEEYQEAVRRGLPMLSRAELLGQLMTNYKIPVAVAGTHGKTTTTSMLSHILLAGEKDPTISVGGILKAIHGNIRVGGSEVFVTEACEYTNSYHHFFPKISIILNIENGILSANRRDLTTGAYSAASMSRATTTGTLIINGEISHLEEILEGLDCNVIIYDVHKKNADFSAKEITHDEKGNVSFLLLVKGQEAGRIQLSVNGLHNVSNALAAIAAASLLDVPMEKIREGLLSFEGTDRRFQYKGDVNGFHIVDDYAHHPTEIRATLEAAKSYPHKETWCVFQPHTYSRTKAFFHEFADALSLADHIILADIYAARETDTLGMSSGLLADELKAKGCDVHYFPGFDEIETFILENCKKDDLLITMGAGDVVNIGESLLKR